MRRYAKNHGVQHRADGKSELALYTVEDTLNIVRLAQDVTHAHDAAGPYCCIAAATLLLAAAEAALRGPAVSAALSPDDVADLRRQSAEHGAAIAEMQAAAGRPRH